MLDDDLADGVGVDQTHVEDEGYKVVLEDDWLEIEIDGHEDPGQQAGDQPNQGLIERLSPLSPHIKDVFHATISAAMSANVSGTHTSRKY